MLVPFFEGQIRQRPLPVNTGESGCVAHGDDGNASQTSNVIGLITLNLLFRKGLGDVI